MWVIQSPFYHAAHNVAFGRLVHRFLVGRGPVPGPRRNFDKPHGGTGQRSAWGRALQNRLSAKHAGTASGQKGCSTRRGRIADRDCRVTGRRSGTEGRRSPLQPADRGLLDPGDLRPGSPWESTL